MSDINKLLESIALPKKYFENDFCFADKFKEEADNFSNLLKGTIRNLNSEDENSVKSLTLIIPMVDDNIKSINEVIEFFESLDSSKAQCEFDTLMNRMKDDLFIASFYDRNIKINNGDNYLNSIHHECGGRYFRVRSFSDESVDNLNNADELFHIPYSKRSLCSNERFSLAGFPSLYLSTSLPLAWQECGYPENYYYSEYQYINIMEGEEEPCNQETRILALYSPDEIHSSLRTSMNQKSEIWLKIVSRYLKNYPLILACSFVNQSAKSPFKQEYIVSHLLMQWVHRNITTVQGISYFSCIDKASSTQNWSGYNIVMPAVRPYVENEYSSILKKNFNWTMPKKNIAYKNIESQLNIDRRYNYRLSEDISVTLKKHEFSIEQRDILKGISDICVYLNLLLDYFHPSNMNLHALESIKTNCKYVYELYKKEKDRKDKDGSNENTTESLSKYEGIFEQFTGKQNDNNGIDEIVERYINLCWNFLPEHSHVQVYYLNHSEIQEQIEKYKNDHILYYTNKLDSSNSIYEVLSQIANECEISIGTLCDNSGGEINEELIRKNPEIIKTPIIIKYNEININSSDEVKSCELLSVGGEEFH
ncbi:MAG: hypothetical protein RR646_02750 [Erysipelotrichaceae bacterium]